MAEIIKVLKDFVLIKGSQTKAAHDLGISDAFMSDMLNGRRAVSDNIADKLGYVKRITWKKKP